IVEAIHLCIASVVCWGISFEPEHAQNDCMTTTNSDDAVRKHTALVLGATGVIGGEVARQLRDDGWRVRALWRGQGAAPAGGEGITWIRGDALDRASVLAAAEGCG